MSAPSPAAARIRHRTGPAIPPQHGAWAYLALPLLLGLTLSGWTWLGFLYAVTWVLAYPASYYAGRALTVRLRRGEWSRIARREAGYAIPWAVAAGAGAVILVVARPWLLVVGAVLAALWAIGVGLSLAGRERGFGNDLLLIGQSLVALPLVWLITTGIPDPAGVPSPIWQATAVCALYFVGSVIHVKSLIREAGNARWRRADIVFHVLSLAIATMSAVLLIPFGVGLGRAVAVRPGTKPAIVGAVEIVMSILVFAGTLIAVG